MTVAELIQKLSKAPSDMLVKTVDPDGWETAVGDVIVASWYGDERTVKICSNDICHGLGPNAEVL